MYQQSELLDFLQGRESIGRTEASAEVPWTKVDQRIVSDKSLSDRALGYMLRLLSVTDRWCFDHLNIWLQRETGKSKATVGRALNELVDAGYLHRTKEYSRTRRQRVYSYRLTEAALKLKDRNPRERVDVLTRVRYCDDPNARGPHVPTKRFGTVRGDVPTSRKARSNPYFSGGPVRHPRRTYKGGMDVPPTSEHPKNPKSPCGGLGALDEFRVCDYDSPDGKPDKTAHGAKRRKGRKSPAKPHNARARNKPQGSRTPKGPQNQRMTRVQFNRSGFRSEADTRDFMANLAVRLQPVLDELNAHTRITYASDLAILRKNPLVAVAQEVWGYETWEHKDLRRFLRILGNRLPVADLLLFWLADNNGRWFGQVPFDMRDRLDRNHPTDPDVRRNQIFPDIVEKLYHWQSQIDACRGWLGELMVDAVDSYLDGFDPTDLSTVATHPLVWTVLSKSPEFCSLGLSEEEEAWVRQTVAEVSSDEVRAWVDEVSVKLPCRWNGQWWAPGRTIANTVFALGVDEITGESLPADLVEWSPYNSNGHLIRTSAWSADVPIPVEELLL